MFDLRYHVASLAAIFLALAVGIILGVALSGKIRGAEDFLSAGKIAQLEAQLDAERSRGSSEGDRLQAWEDLIDDAYPALMENRLVDRGYAIVFLGPVDGELRSAIEKALTDAGGTPVRLFAFELPVDPVSLNDFLESNETLSTYAGDESALGRALGEELMEEGGTPVLDEVSSELVEERSGATIPAVDGAIVVRSWVPGSEDASPASERASETFVEGILQGLQSASLPVVGVETSDVEARSSAVPVFNDAGLSSVDDLDLPGGRLALALLLGGGEPGHYGVKDTASDGVVPPVDAVPVQTIGG
ncbi:MAG TPA: copper transporter [Gaiellaceae bacterium]|nr:copper transporter [Gaiellaceae bacterium]